MAPSKIELASGLDVTALFRENILSPLDAIDAKFLDRWLSAYIDRVLKSNPTADALYSLAHMPTESSLPKMRKACAAKRNQLFVQNGIAPPAGRPVTCQDAERVAAMLTSSSELSLVASAIFLTVLSIPESPIKSIDIPASFNKYLATLPGRAASAPRHPWEAAADNFCTSLLLFGAEFPVPGYRPSPQRLRIMYDMCPNSLREKIELFKSMPQSGR